MPESSIHTEGILCNQCGARLRIASGTNFADCSFCGCQLKIHRSGGAVFSEIIEEIKLAQRRSDDRITVLELTAELEKLEEAWAKFIKSTLADGQTIALQLSNNTGKWMFASIFILSSIIAGNMIANGQNPIAVVAMLGAFVALSASFLWLSAQVGNIKRRDYLAVKKRYEARKEEITSTIAQLQL